MVIAFIPPGPRFAAGIKAVGENLVHHARAHPVGRIVGGIVGGNLPGVVHVVQLPFAAHAVLRRAVGRHIAVVILGPEIIPA